MREAVMSVTVNSQTDSEMLVVLRDEAGALWIDGADFDRLRLLRPAGSGSRNTRGTCTCRWRRVAGIHVARGRIDAEP